MNTEDDTISALQRRNTIPEKAAALATAGYVAFAAVLGFIVWRKYLRP